MLKQLLSRALVDVRLRLAERAAGQVVEQIRMYGDLGKTAWELFRAGDMNRKGPPTLLEGLTAVVAW